MKVAASIFFVTISLIINMTQLTAARHVSELARGVFKQRLLSIPDHPLQAPISNAAITIQKITRGVQNQRRYLIPSSTVQTKIWRQEQSWYMNGKKNECEIYQRNFIEKITNMKCAKSDKRLHIPTKILADNRYPMKEVDGFDWTEDFDGFIPISDDAHLYLNLKFICDAGGSQTRSLREVYHFITTQLDHLVLFPTSSVQFVNILDGNTCANSMDKYEFLLKKPRYSFVKNRVFVGDLNEFQDWWFANYKK